MSKPMKGRGYPQKPERDAGGTHLRLFLQVVGPDDDQQATVVSVNVFPPVRKTATS